MAGFEGREADQALDFTLFPGIEVDTAGVGTVPCQKIHVPKQGAALESGQVFKFVKHTGGISQKGSKEEDSGVKTAPETDGG